MSFILKAVINWILSTFLLPLFSMLKNTYLSKKAEIKANNAVKQIKNAKTKEEIDSAIDSLP
jgi:hypothetical protein